MWFINLVSSKPVNREIYDALTLLQHRGQDASGIVTWDEHGLHARKSNGFIRDVFHQRHMNLLTGNVGMGHVRYPTAGSSNLSEAQPLRKFSFSDMSRSQWKFNKIHDQLAKSLMIEDRRHLNTKSDLEVILNVFAHELQKKTDGEITASSIFEQLEAVH